MKLGDKIKKRVHWTEEEVDKSGIRKRMKRESAEGTVVYIHPRMRFYTLEFSFPGGKFRESFLFR